MHGTFYRSHLSPRTALIPHTVKETWPRNASSSPPKGQFHTLDLTELQGAFISWKAEITMLWAAFLSQGMWLFFVYFIFYYVAYGLSWERICFQQQLWTNAQQRREFMDLAATSTLWGSMHEDLETANATWWAEWWGRKPESFIQLGKLCTLNTAETSLKSKVPTCNPHHTIISLTFYPKKY